IAKPAFCTASDALRSLHFSPTQDNLFKGINCSEQRAHMSTAVSACQPCSHHVLLQRECLQSIKVDLQHYRAVLLAYCSPALDATVVQAIDDLMELQFKRESVLLSSFPQDSSVKDHTFDERLQMCKVLKGFRIRAITITRVLSYITAEQHKD
uniref:Interleukin-12 subunit alpha n=1 Tax=Scleropages formosus TaxID=113540 RepID=A0A8C9RHA2_SCLFO